MKNTADILVSNKYITQTLEPRIEFVNLKLLCMIVTHQYD